MTSSVANTSLAAQALHLQNIRDALEDRKIRTAAELFADLKRETQKEAFDLLCAKFRDKCTHGNVVRDGVDLVFDDPVRLLSFVDNKSPTRIIDRLLLTEETIQLLAKILEEKQQQGVFHKRLLTFLTTNDNDYDLERDFDFSLEDTFGILWFDHEKNPQDQAFLERISTTEYWNSAIETISEYPGPCKKFLAGPTKLGKFDIAEILRPYWGSKRDAVYQLFKEVVKHCIIRDAAKETNEGKGKIPKEGLEEWRKAVR